MPDPENLPMPFPSSTSSGCLQQFDQYGRQGIGVTQPYSGTDYPLLEPSEDIRYLLADMHVAIEQPTDYTGEPPYQLPLRIQWLYGFGCDDPEWTLPLSASCESFGSSANCQPTPRHSHDIILTDQDGRIVFDSTQQAVQYDTREWGDRLRVVTWRQADEYVSIVYHTAWSPTEQPEPRDYPVYFFPDQAILDSRSVTVLPRRVRSLNVVFDHIRDDVEFVPGHNMQIRASGVNTLRAVTQIEFSAIPGAGEGRFPDCLPGPVAIRRINGVSPAARGDFYLSAKDCYWVRQPTRILTDNPRTSLPEVTLSPGNIPTPGLPSPLAGTTKDAPGWPPGDDKRYAHLQMGNDCVPCCDCEDYVETAQYMNQIRDKYAVIGQALNQSRDQYHSARDRWLAAAQCRAHRPLRVQVVAQICPFVDIVIQYCNQTDECHSRVVLSVDLTTTPGGGYGLQIPGYAFITGARQSPTGRMLTERYLPGGDWPTFTAAYDVVQPHQSVSARFRLQIGDCGMVGDTTYAINACLSGTIDGVPVTRPATEIAPEEVIVVCDTQTLNCPAGLGSTINPFNCGCT